MKQNPFPPYRFLGIGMMFALLLVPALLASGAAVEPEARSDAPRAAGQGLDAEVRADLAPGLGHGVGALSHGLDAQALGLSADETLTLLGRAPVAALEMVSSCIPPYCCIDQCHERFLRCEARCGTSAPLCEYACVLEYQNCEDACL